MLIADFTRAVSVLRRLKALGVKIATRETVDEVRGYLLGRPYPIKHYVELIGHPVDATKSASRAN